MLSEFLFGAGRQCYSGKFVIHEIKFEIFFKLSLKLLMLCEFVQHLLRQIFQQMLKFNVD